MMQSEVSMSAMDWVEYERRLVDGATPILLPCGALEQHGPHLPLGTDALLASAIAASVARKINGLVAPALHYGYKSQPRCGGGQHFPGTTSLDGQSLSFVVRDLLREFARQGARSLVVIDGHYENQWFLIEGIDLALRDIGNNDVQVMRLEYWDFLSSGVLEEIFPDGFPGFALEHAAVIETSLMLHYYPELVHLNRLPHDEQASFPPYDIFPQRSNGVPASGVLSSAKNASAQKGALMARALTDSIAAAVEREFLNGMAR